MEEGRCLVTIRASRVVDLNASRVVKLYGRRFTIEETFRDQKDALDARFGVGLSATHTKSCARRDRILLIAALAGALLPLLERRENHWPGPLARGQHVQNRQYSLLSHGPPMWYSLLDGLDNHDGLLLMQHYDRLVREQEVFRQMFGVL